MSDDVWECPECGGEIGKMCIDEKPVFAFCVDCVWKDGNETLCPFGDGNIVRNMLRDRIKGE